MCDLIFLKLSFKQAYYIPCRLQGLEDTAVKICKDYGPETIAALGDQYRQVLNSPRIANCKCCIYK